MKGWLIKVISVNKVESGDTNDIGTDCRQIMRDVTCCGQLILWKIVGTYVNLTSDEDWSKI